MPLISRVGVVFGAFVLGATYLMAEGVLHLSQFESGSWVFKVVIWVGGLIVSICFFGLGSRFAHEQTQSVSPLAARSRMPIRIVEQTVARSRGGKST